MIGLWDILRKLARTIRFGQARRTARRKYRALDHFAGSWTREQADEFDRHRLEQRRIDPELWK